ncbi:hypothetical protein C8J57DRAFT_1711704, partial [Mycena rebaudengoi]
MPCACRRIKEFTCEFAPADVYGRDPDADSGGGADALPNNDAGPKLSMRRRVIVRRSPAAVRAPQIRVRAGCRRRAARSRHCSPSASSSSSSSSPSQSSPAAASPSLRSARLPAPHTLPPHPRLQPFPPAHTHRPARHNLRLLRHPESKSPDPRAEHLIRLAGTPLVFGGSCADEGAV